MTTTTPYDDDYDPEDFAHFEALEDRDDLADLPLDLKPCESCDGELKVRGAPISPPPSRSSCAL